MTPEEERELRDKELVALQARADALRKTNSKLSSFGRNVAENQFLASASNSQPRRGNAESFNNLGIVQYFRTPEENARNQEQYDNTSQAIAKYKNILRPTVDSTEIALAAPSSVAPSSVAPAGLQPGPVIPRALQGSGPSASLAAPSQGTAMSYFKKYEDMMNKSPDMTAMNEYARQRSQGGDLDMLNSLAAAYAGERYAPNQASHLKRAMAARGPLEVSGGMLTNKGFVEDPYAARKAAAETALNIAKQINESEQSALRQGSIDARAVDRVTDLFGRAASTAAGKAAGTAAQNQPMVEANFNAVMDSLNAFDSPEVKNEAGYALGLVGSRVGSIPGLNSNFLNRREQLQGQAFLQAFEALKGGGAISEVEGEKATTAIARLQRATTEKDFYDALGDVKKVFSNAYAARSKMAAAGANAVPQLGGGPSSQTGGISESNAAPAVQEFGAPPPGAVRPKVKQ